MKSGPKPRPVFDRIMERVEMLPDAPGCWIQTGSTAGPKGYGTISVKRSIARLAHRVMYEVTRGPIPEGLQVCHHCDTPCCVNPRHLFLGTQRDNEDDKIRKGRTKRGPANPNWKGGCRAWHRAERLRLAAQAVARDVSR